MEDNRENRATDSHTHTRAVSGPELRFFTSLEVAEILKMHPQVITRKLQAGEIAGYKLGKDWRVSEAQLHEFLARHLNRSALARDNQHAGDVDARVVDTFIVNGKLKSIPVQRTKRLAVLKHLVDKLDANRVYGESEINDFLSAYHSDVCTLRREFIMNKLMVRKNGKYKVSPSLRN